MTAEEVTKIVQDYLKEDLENRSAMTLISDGEKTVSFCFGKRKEIVQMFYSLLIEDKKEIFISCIDEAMDLYLQNKRLEEGNTLLNLMVPKSKYKS